MHMPHIIRSLASHAFDIVFPNACMCCGTYLSRGDVACDPCLHAITIYTSFLCSVCQKPYPQDALPPCHPNQLYTLGAATAYAGLTKALVHELKFEYVRIAAQPLAEILIRYITQYTQTTTAWHNAIMLAIPLHPDKEKIRGFNQVHDIATIAANRLHMEYSDKLLIKTTATKPQHELSRNERLTNTKDCFTVTDPARIAGRTVILIDDVVTTGATMHTAAETLLGAGARAVYCLGVAHST